MSSDTSSNWSPKLGFSYSISDGLFIRENYEGYPCDLIYLNFTIVSYKGHLQFLTEEEQINFSGKNFLDSEKLFQQYPNQTFIPWSCEELFEGIFNGTHVVCMGGPQELKYDYSLLSGYRPISSEDNAYQFSKYSVIPIQYNNEPHKYLYYWSSDPLENFMNFKFSAEDPLELRSSTSCNFYRDILYIDDFKFSDINWDIKREAISYDERLAIIPNFFDNIRKKSIVIPLIDSTLEPKSTKVFPQSVDKRNWCYYKCLANALENFLYVVDMLPSLNTDSNIKIPEVKVKKERLIESLSEFFHTIFSGGETYYSFNY
ncbi:hypothetical protein Kpol_381p3 [Vanderwaltozyma polyspora DSM 70294]|uniref:Sir1 ORC-binding domain-containing protein n=1 Tax=Vanderwaltozyma polyspora (strain ATCC 22028 / DSM 70294 / BCRC 21397 / CBS 2163 / NBRC 10782 / NRRL Y-8283 / UCD 57-17) TaxID=436907 RepID=A7TSQ1_VANPO|nr:uncharacterized protein Kpol_381p3 [Vanderwaltozyma polyspora DSM 70294]EDO14704.1 hypothetical protein Kpol_381p3 [Vanderwaltozyma polyspora DSM 70294]